MSKIEIREKNSDGGTCSEVEMRLAKYFLAVLMWRTEEEVAREWPNIKLGYDHTMGAPELRACYERALERHRGLYPSHAWMRL